MGLDASFNSLPICAALAELKQALSNSRNVVLQAPPGAGKSTGVPLALLDAPWLGAKKILMLEPRRLAARAVATRMAALLHEPVGRTVGYRTRLDSKISADTRIEVVTEGILTRRLQNDAELPEVAIVIFDEFHERSLHADLGLALCQDVQANLRDDLQLLVMSATLDGETIAKLLDAPIVTAQGRAFPVDTVYRERHLAANRNDADTAKLVASSVLRAIATHAGDILVFLPGQGEIHRVQRLLLASELPAHLDVLPLYGELPPAAQDMAIRPSATNRRKIVLTTNIAETSLTIEGISVVIDSGLARRSRFDPTTGMSRLDVARISRAAADQRRGRAGRLQAGVCYRLWTETEHASLAAHTPPEILAADLAPLALELANWGNQDAAALRWLDAPPIGTLSQARELLHSLQAIDASGRITNHGRMMAKIAAHPRVAHMLLRAQALGLSSLAVELAGLLGERDLLRYKSFDARDVDLRLRLDALHDHSLPPNVDVDRGARQRALRNAEIFLQSLTDKKIAHRTPGDDDAGLLLAYAFPDRIAQARGGRGRYLLSNGRGAYLADPQALGNSTFLVVAELDDSDREARIRLAAPIARETLEKHCGDAIVEKSRIEWDVSEQAVVARTERLLGALLLDERKLNNVPPEKLVDAMLNGVRELTLNALPWTSEARALQARMEFVRSSDVHATTPWAPVNDAALLANLETWLTPWLNGITRRDHLSQLNMCEILLAMLNWTQQTRLQELAPTHFAAPSGSNIAIDYATTPPTLAVRLQEIFGLRETPRVADGRVALLLQLLSPARRPVQTTQDLTSFWARGYHDVKKDLKGRYPKHYWPDDPLQAQATARAKPRK